VTLTQVMVEVMRIMSVVCDDHHDDYDDDMGDDD
jgi:hypothetical protein